MQSLPPFHNRYREICNAYWFHKGMSTFETMEKSGRGPFKHRVKKIATRLEESFDSITRGLRQRLNANKPLQIVTYRTYGTNHRLFVKGRVLRDPGLVKSEASDSLWMNIVNMYRRFESDEVPGVTVRVTFHGSTSEVITDKEGYFTIHLAAKEPIVSDSQWYEVEISVQDPLSLSTVKTLAHVLIPPSDAEYGIISDIDDTIVKTTATSLVAMARNTFLHNAHTRLPFAGVSEFYQSLLQGKNGKRNNPFFYVSSSPWNLYDLLTDFLDINDIPEGPLLLRDFGLDASKTSDDHMGHKFHEITNILATYPSLKFVLIGDSGQEDPKIYREVVRAFPDRIVAIYIRDVQLAEREKIAIDISQELNKGGTVEMIIVDNSVEAADHAARTGLIFREDLPKIKHDKELDKGQKDGKSTM